MAKYTQQETTALGGGIGGGVGGLIGYLAGGGDRRHAEDDQKRIMDLINSLSLPSIEEQQVNLQGTRDLGQVGPSGFNSISVDPAVRQMQMSALRQLQGEAEGGGMDPQAKLAEYQARQNAATYERGQREAIAQNVAARGMGNGGAGLASSLVAQQGGANSAYAGGLQAASDAKSRQLQAMNQLLSGAGSFRGQEYGEQADRARANDAIAQFNAQNRMAGGMFNANVGNQQELHNKGLYQQDFDNRYRKTGLQTGAYHDDAEMYKQRAADKAKIGQGVGQGIGSIGGFIPGLF